MKVGILGAGAYALALAHILDKNKLDISIWTFSKEEEKELTETRKSSKLKNYKLPSHIEITTNMENVVKNSKIIIIAVPAFAVRETAKTLSQYIDKNSHILITSKGIENDTCMFLTDVINKYIDTNKIAVLSGPTFAADIIKNAHIGLNLATTNNSTKKLITSLIENSHVKIKPTKDVIGVQICNSIKNVLAIFSGILEGMNVTDSTKALFITEVLNDTKELIKDLGGNKNTILSLSGIGDIIMTSTSIKSRNFTFGKLIGEGKIEEANSYASVTTVEGLYTLKTFKKLLKKEHLKMYIIELLSDIIYENKDKNEILNFLIYK